MLKCFFHIFSQYQEQKLKCDVKTDAEREQDEKEAAANLDYRFISNGSSRDPSKDMEEKVSIHEYMRNVNEQGRKEDDDSEEAMALQLAEQGKGMGDFEEAMASKDEVSMPAKYYHWQDKYRPRKPR